MTSLLRRSIVALSLLFGCLIGAQGQSTFHIREITLDPNGRLLFTVPSTTAHYYVLYHRPTLALENERPLAIINGEEEETVLRDQLGLRPSSGYYRVSQHDRAQPDDIDGDGLDDVFEMSNSPTHNALNPAKIIDFRDGSGYIPDRETFKEMSYQGLEVLIDTHLEDLEFVKFQIENAHTDRPEVYFLNTVTHRAHFRFMSAVRINRGGPGQMRGEIIYHPNVIAPNGKPGFYRFEFQPNDSYPFERVRLGYELIAACMPFLENNFAYYPMPNSALPRYHAEKDLFDASRVHILLEEDLFANIGFLPLNPAASFGRLRVMELDERPTSRDVVLYATLPNELPRVAGIITEVPQTPLSHVNLRAVQDKLPNAFIANASENAVIKPLIGKWVYYEVTPEGFEIREASLEEVDTHFEDIRPTEPQIPPRDLTQTEIQPLTDIVFDDSASYGVKTANLATLHTLDFPDRVVPDGFGVPFHFYDAFMKHNGFYTKVQDFLADSHFQTDLDYRAETLEDLRNELEDGTMPTWMTDALTELQNQFDANARIRCRSSTNNEDLPGFSGAGLYDSFTHRPDEGHLSKSIKQVFASLWNFRAFEEREFYRIDHLAAAMGVLVHLSFSDEQANGVAVTTDPFYQSTGNFYINSQIGEDLVTNPEDQSVPEEVLINRSNGRDFTVVRESNRVEDGDMVLSRQDLQDLQIVLKRIHDGFARHYGVLPWNTKFAMEIEFKIASDGLLTIKQARPWVF